MFGGNNLKIALRYFVKRTVLTNSNIGLLISKLRRTYLLRSEHRPSTKERHCFLSVAIFSISFRVYPISFVSFSVSLCQVFRGLPLLLFPGGFHVMA